MWEGTGVRPALVSAGYRVISLDTRGHGKSDKPHDLDFYGAHMAEDVLRLMDHLEIPKAHVIGYSMGARLTGYLFAKHPDRLLSATLGASPPRRRWDDAAQQRARNMSESIEEQGRSADPSDDRDYAALAAIPRSWQSQVVTDAQLVASSVPVLAIVGSEDPNLPGLEELKTVKPTLKLVVIDGATHAGERGAAGHPEFLAEIRNFIGSH